MPEAGRVRIAVAQTTSRQDPRRAETLREGGAEVRRLMHEARAAGARVVLFPEGAITCPGKRVLSRTGPERVGPADWSRVAWAALDEQLAAIAETARELGLWTVLGSAHRLTPPHRPHNSMYVLSDQGRIVTRYDERLLSHTKLTHMYTPGAAPAVFEVDAMRFGCLLGMEVHFPELFTEYERLGVDCVLFAASGGGPGETGFGTEARGLAAANGCWVAFSALAGACADAPAGLIGPHGEWLARAAAAGGPGLAVADLDHADEALETALFKARPWRRTARAGLYEPHLVRDERSEDRTSF